MLNHPLIGKGGRKHNSIDCVFKSHPGLLLCTDLPKYHVNLNINDIFSKDYSTDIKRVTSYWVRQKVHSGFFHTILWKTPNKIFGQPSIYETISHTQSFLLPLGKPSYLSLPCLLLRQTLVCFLSLLISFIFYSSV